MKYIISLIFVFSFALSANAQWFKKSKTVVTDTINTEAAFWNTKVFSTTAVVQGNTDIADTLKPSNLGTVLTLDLTGGSFVIAADADLDTVWADGAYFDIITTTLDTLIFDGTDVTLTPHAETGVSGVLAHARLERTAADVWRIVMIVRANLFNANP